MLGIFDVIMFSLLREWPICKMSSSKIGSVVRETKNAKRENQTHSQSINTICTPTKSLIAKFSFSGS